jgi:uncharacterized damage-inducible protein DinB
MDQLTTIRDAHAWLRWLSGRTLAAAETLTHDELHRRFEIGLGSVHGTLVHLYGAECIWIEVVQGRNGALTMPPPDAFPTLARLRDAWGEVRLQWDAYLAQLTPAACERIVTRSRDGKTWNQRVGDALMQVPTHALYHNAQLSFMFRSMGKQLPDSSWILWSRERVAQPGA